MASPQAIPHSIGRIEAHIEAHDTAIAELRDQAREDRADVRALRNWILGTLAAALGGTVLQIFTLMARK